MHYDITLLPLVIYESDRKLRAEMMWSILFLFCFLALLAMNIENIASAPLSLTYVIFFMLSLAVAINIRRYRTKARDALLTLDDNGITVHVARHARFMWKEIVEFNMDSTKGGKVLGKFINIVLHDDAESSGVTSFLRKTNQLFTKGDFSFSLNDKGHDLTEVMEVLRIYHQRHKAGLLH